MNDPRLDPENVRAYLTGFHGPGPRGDRPWHPGILERAGRRVRETLSGWKPSGANWPYSSNQRGSIIGTGGLAGGGGSGDSATLELAVTVDRWLGNPTDAHGLKEFLVKNHMSDGTYLLGRGGRDLGRLEIARREAIRRLDREPPDVESCLDLADQVRAWLETSCEHSFRPLRDTEFVVCDRCGLGEPDPAISNGGLVSAAEVGILARCEVCGKPLERAWNGRTRYTCSEACKKQRQRWSITRPGVPSFR